MEQFNIKNVIEYYKLNTEDLAKVLFPAIKYPKQALDRVLKGEGTLDITQVEKLANYIGVLVTDLFSANTWKGSAEDGCLTLLKGQYKAKLNYNGVYLSIYKDNVLIEQKISNIPSMTIQEFINFLDNLIKNYENGSH
jgi:hypothetical protein